ncbi:MAG: HAMP domain-containing histidine kinase [Chloroflexi bacterium]|nr:HAMP domain-containing histidine kinase [Chloroflexota bacterium]
MVDANGNCCGSAAVVTDISSEKATAEALQRALEQERELGQLKSRFVSMASHEFRTPLAAIAAKAETLLYYRDRLSDDKREDRLRGILEQVDRMREIMEDVLQLARIQAGRVEFRPESGDFDKFCREIINEFSAQPEYEERLALNFENSPLPYSFDRRLMRHVVSNLISNALKYSASDTPVLVTLRADEGAITLMVEDQGDWHSGC